MAKQQTEGKCQRTCQGSRCSHVPPRSPVDHHPSPFKAKNGRHIHDNDLPSQLYFVAHKEKLAGALLTPDRLSQVLSISRANGPPSLEPGLFAYDHLKAQNHEQPTRSFAPSTKSDAAARQVMLQRLQGDVMARVHGRTAVCILNWNMKWQAPRCRVPSGILHGVRFPDQE